MNIHKTLVALSAFGMALFMVELPAQASYQNGGSSPDGCYAAMENFAGGINSKTAYSYGSPYCRDIAVSWNGAFDYNVNNGPSVSSFGFGTAVSSGHAFVSRDGYRLAYLLNY
jgi:hypothetical protein